MEEHGPAHLEASFSNLSIHMDKYNDISAEKKDYPCSLRSTKAKGN